MSLSDERCGQAKFDFVEDSIKELAASFNWLELRKAGFSANPGDFVRVVVTVEKVR